MNIELTPEMTLERITEVLKSEFPECQVELKKNPLFRNQYVEVKKTAFVGAWINAHPKKNKLSIQGAIPSALVRGLIGGLLLILFLAKSHKRMTTDIATILKDEFKTV